MAIIMTACRFNLTALRTTLHTMRKTISLQKERADRHCASPPPLNLMPMLAGETSDREKILPFSVQKRQASISGVFLSSTETQTRLGSYQNKNRLCSQNVLMVEVCALNVADHDCRTALSNQRLIAWTGRTSWLMLTWSLAAWATFKAFWQKSGIRPTAVGKSSSSKWNLRGKGTPITRLWCTKRGKGRKSARNSEKQVNK